MPNRDILDKDLEEELKTLKRLKERRDEKEKRYYDAIKENVYMDAYLPPKVSKSTLYSLCVNYTTALRAVVNKQELIIKLLNLQEAEGETNGNN